MSPLGWFLSGLAIGSGVTLVVLGRTLDALERRIRALEQGGLDKLLGPPIFRGCQDYAVVERLSTHRLYRVREAELANLEPAGDWLVLEHAPCPPPSGRCRAGRSKREVRAPRARRPSLGSRSLGGVALLRAPQAPPLAVVTRAPNVSLTAQFSRVENADSER